jgi:hypothetical protein
MNNSELLKKKIYIGTWKSRGGLNVTAVLFKKHSRIPTDISENRVGGGFGWSLSQY